MDIKSIYRSNCGKKLNFDIDIIDSKGNIMSSDILWYEVSEKHKDGFCDLIDGVVVSLLPYAIRDGYNIKSSIGISQKLFYNLTYHLLPQFSAKSSEY